MFVVADMVVEDGTGLTTANVYVSLANANAYNEKRLYSTTWDNADDEKKARALVWATRLLDEQCSWKGERTTTTQALGWPRAGVLNRDRDASLASDAVPQFVAYATSEMARHLLEKNRPDDAENQAVQSSSTQRGSKSVTRDTKYKAVIPPSVQAIVAPYLRANTFRVERV